jgi:alkylated DNA repair protein (DNA oxidative demethylase)
VAAADGLSGSLTLELFARAEREQLAEGAVVLRGLACAEDAEIKSAVAIVGASAPFRYMVTPGGFRMSVAMTNCGRYGWVSDDKGYQYAALDPLSGRAWPAMPAVFTALAGRAAALAGFAAFAPDACLVNRYEPGARLTLHQDKDERDFGQPIVSVSLGVQATFLFGGVKRRDRVTRVVVEHGDVVVWGGPSRLRYHGVAPLRSAQHPFAGGVRVNLTLRRAR